MGGRFFYRPILSVVGFRGALVNTPEKQAKATREVVVVLFDRLFDHPFFQFQMLREEVD